MVIRNKTLKSAVSFCGESTDCSFSLTKKERRIRVKKIIKVEQKE